jgi:hypothetical protein
MEREGSFMKISCIARIGISALSAIVITSLGVTFSWAQNAALRG